MNELIYRPSAEADLTAIALYLSSQDIDRAYPTIDRLEKRIQALVAHPFIGRARPEFGEGIRSLVERPYLILYRVQPPEIEIVAVLHGARNVARIMKERREDE